jgi:Fe(3+) dicitrate transport protein
MRIAGTLAALLATWLIVLPREPLLAQTLTQGSLEGRVSGSAGPLGGATVRLDGTGYLGTTDSTGRYRLVDLPAGTYAVTVMAEGYVPRRDTVPVSALEVARLDLTLAPRIQRLKDVSVTGAANDLKSAARLPDVRGGEVFAGKKTEVVRLDSLDVNTVQNVARQVLGRVPGLTVSETEGQGFPSNGIGFRGLNPTQSIEINVRQNGYNIAADPYGYPEAYFIPPAEAVERVELVRGASSLGYGSQFGGMVNYVLRDGVEGSRPVLRSRVTGASFNTYDGFADVAGGTSRVTYYGFAQYRGSDGWRPNSDGRQVSAFGRVRWRAGDRFRVGLEYTLFRNRIHMPGGLTDEAFGRDPRTSYRTRNWLGSPWNLLALTGQYLLSPNASITTTVWGSLSQRYLVWRNEDGGAGALDAIDPATQSFVPREVEREKFTNLTAESRLAYSFPLLGRTGTLAAGIRAFTGRMHRQEGGPGSTGSDFDLALYGGPYEKDVSFYNTNVSAHVEQLVRLGELTVTPGIRIEYLHSAASGYTDTTFTPLTRNRTFALPGLAAQLRTSATSELYGSVARSYRPIDYSSLTPFASVSRIDPKLADPSGYSSDLGWRGRVADSAVAFDVSLFQIHYGKRIGLVSGTDPDGTPYTLRTNVGTSVHRGIETYVELHALPLLGASPRWGALSVFDAFAYTDAKYTDGEFAGNRVEYAPRLVNRTGVTYARGGFSGTLQLSSVGQAFGDANNTVTSADANVGVIPAYHVLDLSTRLRLTRRYQLSAGANNLADAAYFTRRTDEYPGPGIIPSPGRSFYLSAGATF